ncbi:MAG: aminoglycoside phosphotransferase family protein [Oscillospiraceae bacterium]|nr:aminoglycoside phosphotransferase family protein [Oscillospiraceae bacterium]
MPSQKQKQGVLSIATSAISELLRQFALEEEYDAIAAPKELLDGHINHTYVVGAQSAAGATHRYLLQRINTFVFRRPQELMENIKHVTTFIRQKLPAGQTTLTVYPTKTGALYYETAEGDCWRCYNYIEGTYSLQAAASAQDAYRAARAFGSFQRLLDGCAIGELHETIPDFHNTQKRYAAFEAAVAADAFGRRAEVEAEIAFARARQADAARLLQLLQEGKLPLRVTHNDTKLNNVLFDAQSNEPVCVVDLDTVMPGLSLYDFGDSLRFLGNTAAEDERDLTKVQFDLPLFEAYTKGYLAEAGKALNAEEIRWLPFSVKLMTYECGMRFLTDYLENDVYFRIHKPDDNLARCRTQFRLVEKIEEALPQMERFVRGISY